jgi:alpha-tubulin suppressor-like RCC1 family protein
MFVVIYLFYFIYFFNTDAGNMYTWGRGDYGVLGRGEEPNQLQPKLVPIPGGEKMMRASAGFWHNLATNGI